MSHLAPRPVPDPSKAGAVSGRAVHSDSSRRCDQAGISHAHPPATTSAGADGGDADTIVGLDHTHTRTYLSISLSPHSSYPFIVGVAFPPCLLRVPSPVGAAAWCAVSARLVSAVGRRRCAGEDCKQRRTTNAATTNPTHDRRGGGTTRHRRRTHTATRSSRALLARLARPPSHLCVVSPLRKSDGKGSVVFSPR